MKDLIKEAVLKLLEENDDYPFNELIGRLEQMNINPIGDRVINLKENSIIWEGTNSDFNNAIIELNDEKKIGLLPMEGRSGMLVYGTGGSLPNLPIGSPGSSYKTPHWIPTIIKKVK